MPVKRIEPSLDINRRDFIAAASSVTALGMVTISGNAIADDEGDTRRHHKHHELKHQDLVEAALECVAKGQACISHCLDLMANGDTSVAECAKSVNLMTPFCDTFARFAVADSAHLKDMAKMCVKVCENCEKACHEHEDEHVECYECAEACRDLIKACGKYLA
jgi:Cys-rich four helix bundle protein (predicted Tat secretion target)